MTRVGWVVMGISVLAIALLLGAYGWLHSRTMQSAETTQALAPVPDIDPSALSIYTSGEYGFAFFYPSQATVTDSFSEGDAVLDIPWRIHALATGTPIVRVTAGREEARIGVSSDTREVSACMDAGPGERELGSLEVGSTTWHQYAFEKLGTDQESSVISYRTMHNDSCYVIDVLTPVDAQAPTGGYSLRDIMSSFSFAN